MKILLLALMVFAGGKASLEEVESKSKEISQVFNVKRKKIKTRAKFDEARAAYQAEMLEAAEGFLKQGVQEEALLELAKMFRYADDEKRALILTTKSVKAKPTKENLSFRCSLYTSMKEPAKAEADLAALRKMGDEVDWTLLNGLGMAFLDAKENDKAIQYLQETISAIPEKYQPSWAPHLVGTIAGIHLTNDDRSKAVSVVDAAMKDFEGNERAMSQFKILDQQIGLIGKEAPEIPEGIWVGGESTSLADLRGKVVILDFFAFWCGPCIVTFPHMKDLYAKNKDKGLEILGPTTYYGYFRHKDINEKDISKEKEVEYLKVFRDDHGLPWKFSVQESRAFARSYGVNAIPHMVFIDRAGKVRFFKMGAGNYETIDHWVEKLLAEPDPTSGTK